MFVVFWLVAAGLPDVSHAQSEPASGTEKWYVVRGEANMEIGNYGAAIEAFEKAVQLNPGNRQASRQLGIAYERQGLTAKAIEQYDRYLARFSDDPEIAFKQAEYLGAERYAYRRADAIRYYRMGLAEQDDPARRHALARLLGSDRAQLAPALEQYRILLAQQPNNATWRKEYRELLLWDERFLDEAVQEQRQLAKEKPADFGVQRTLARLVARQNPRGDEAVRLYGKLVTMRPRDADLRLEYAELLSSSPSRRDEAIAQYRKVLEQKPEPATREALADLLSGSAATRKEALDNYRELVRQRPKDARLRLKYANLLASERSDAPEAIRQYSAVVDQDPKNARAHEGLAESYAWVGDRDAALLHSDLAVRYGAKGREAHDLRRQLMRGREPRIAPFVNGLWQTGDSKSDLGGAAVGASGRFDASPFVTFDLEAGAEAFWSHGEDTTAGFGSVSAEYRPEPGKEFDFGLGYHSLSDGGDNILGNASYAWTDDPWSFRAGFERKLRYDSYIALVGESVEGTDIGSARENRLYFDWSTKSGPLRANLVPYGGWVTADDVDDNYFLGLRGHVDYGLVDEEVYQLSFLYRGEIYSYGDDAFGVVPSNDEPYPGGYFSPQLFVEQMLGFSLGIRWAGNRFLDLEGGPALQLVDESGGGSEWQLGGEARLSFVFFLNDSLFWTLQTNYTSVGSAYTRVDGKTSLTFKF